MGETASRRYKRRRYLKESTQGRLLVRVYSVVLLALAISAGFIYLVMNRHLEDNYRKAHIMIGSTLEGLAPWMLAASIVGLLAVLLLLLRFTLSVAGPEYRLCRVVKAIGAGEFDTPVHLRRGDQLVAIAETVNEAMDALSTRFGGVREARDELIRMRDAGGDRDRITQAISLLDQALAGIQIQSEKHS